ncbi:hypothetical protein DFH07DRAFT_939030 [Mycena maculata]|uniref:F-box domain-containing protein n=1 Tax=Mycena maculata TaxID=230809 RepID=A0AAD7JHT4_9AGAR|nr:hypothetical protein DFH07DRAFT_939030 [Mycena maculata]
MESAFASHLNTNFDPSDEDIERIRSDIVSRLAELEGIDERIRELSTQRDRIQGYIDSHKAIISHPRRLPPDIIREIFIVCLPADRNAVMSAQEAPLILCRICSAWRFIALSTPRLWSTLHVPAEFILAKKQARLSAIAQWLRLSGSCQLSLSLATLGEPRGWATPSAPNDPADVSAIIKALALPSDRWCNIEVSHLSEEAALQFADFPTPMLESVEITAEVSALRQINLFRAPSLRAVSLHAWLGTERLDDFLLDLPFFWDRLTHISFDCTGHDNPSQGLSLHNVLTLLRRCSRLIFLGFRPNAEGSWAESNSEPLMLPFLKSFIMFGPAVLNVRAVGRLLRHLSMPELCELHVPAVSSTEPDSYFLATIGTTSPLLEHLLINIQSFTKDSILETLRYLPKLTMLVALNTPSWSPNPWPMSQPSHDPVVDRSNPEHLLVLLAPDPETQSLTVCSGLRELQLSDCDLLDKNTVAEFLQKRMDFANDFHRLEIFFQRPWKAMSADEIQSFTSRGLDLSFVHGHDPWGADPVESNPWTGLSSAGHQI